MMANYKTTVNKDGSQQFVRGKNFKDQIETIYGKDGQSQTSLARGTAFGPRDTMLKEDKAREMMFQAMMDEIDTDGTSGKAVMKGRGGKFKGVK
jgi:hypothetical protein